MTPTSSASVTPSDATNVSRTAQRFRADVAVLLEPGGLNRDNVSVVAGWFDAGVWSLLEANEAALGAWRRGEAP